MLFCLALSANGTDSHTRPRSWLVAACTCVFVCEYPVGNVTEGAKKPVILCGDVTDALLFVCIQIIAVFKCDG